MRVLRRSGQVWALRAGVAVAIAVGLSGVVACGSREVPVSEVVIGVTVPLTGSDALVGESARRGYERALAEARAGGGIRLANLGRTVAVRLDLRDDVSETPQAEQLVGALFDAGAHVVIATPNAVRAAAQADVAERIARVLVVNTVDAPGLPGSRMRWVIGVAADGDVEARAFATLQDTLAGIAAASTLDPAGIRLALSGSR
jgi:ABC-type branched-subunit amino acid transport system substrate-binding protein